LQGHVEKKRGRYYVVLELERDVRTGQRKRKWVGGFAKKKEADAALIEHVYRGNAGTYVSPSKRTVANFMEEWLQTLKPTVRPSTWECYRMNSQTRIAPLLGAIELRRLGAVDLNRAYAVLLESGRADGKGGLSPRSVRLVHVTIHRALRDAVRWGLLARNVGDLADPPKHIKTEMNTWTAEEVHRFLDHVRADRLYPCFLLLLTTGLRRGELAGLRWEDVDFDARRISIRRSRVVVGYGNVVVSDPKTSRGRRVLPLDVVVVEALRAHRARQLQERLALGAGYEGDGQTLFTHEDGTSMHPDQISYAFEKAASAGGLPRIRLHDLRHTYATLALQAGVPLWAVSDILGHASIAITSDVYRHSIPAMLEEAAGTVAELMLRKQGGVDSPRP